MKQTAVEWLEEALMTSENAPYYNQWAFNKAKEMEKEQMKEWWAKGWNDGHLSTLQENTETFKSE